MRAKVLEEANMKAQSSEEKNSDDGKPSNVVSLNKQTFLVLKFFSWIQVGKKLSFISELSKGDNIVCRTRR